VVDQFRKVVSVFCLFSYYDQKYEFTHSELNSYIEKAIAFCGIEATSRGVIAELTESVNLIQKEGLVFLFSHRSFQEYFAAYCIVFVMPTKSGSITAALISRYFDETIRMAYDMNPDVIESNYIMPMFDKYQTSLHDACSVDTDVQLLLRLELDFGVELEFGKEERDDMRSYMAGPPGELSKFCTGVLNLVQPDRRRWSLLSEVDHKHFEILTEEVQEKIGQLDREAIASVRADIRLREEVPSVRLSTEYRDGTSDQRSYPLGESAGRNLVVELGKHCRRIVKSTRDFCESIKKRRAREIKTIEELLADPATSHA
jgi:hypothetical protein